MIGIDKPEVSVKLVQEAIAAFLRQVAGATVVYRNPNTQNTKLPCWFVNLIPESGITKSLSQRYWRTFTFDLVYMEQFNEDVLFDHYLAKAELLDETLDLLAYPYLYQKDEDSEPEHRMAYFHTINRNWTVGRDMLHYRFEIQFRSTISKEAAPKMMVIEELHEFIKEVTADGKTIYYEW